MNIHCVTTLSGSFFISDLSNHSAEQVLATILHYRSVFVLSCQSKHHLGYLVSCTSPSCDFFNIFFYFKITASEVIYNLVCEQTPVLFLLCLKGCESFNCILGDNSSTIHVMYSYSLHYLSVFNLQLCIEKVLQES